MKRDKKGSLTRELAVILVGLVAGTIMLCWFINTSFLEKYYMLNKQDSLIDGYDVINGASETGELNSSEFDVTFDNLCANGNIAVMIISSNRAIVRSSVNDNQVILMEFIFCLVMTETRPRSYRDQTITSYRNRQIQGYHLSTWFFMEHFPMEI